MSLFQIVTSPQFIFKECVPQWLIANYQICMISITVYPLIVHMYPKSLTISHKNSLLQFCLFLWNFILALYSIISVYKLTPPLMMRIYYDGYHESICLTDQENSFLYQPYGRWVFLFILSKIVEFGDTFFLLIRNKKIKFLHWYHHLITLLFAYVQGILLLETFEWVTWMNAVVHSCMYFYYSINVYKPLYIQRISTCITTLQVLQMCHGMFITGYHIHYCTNNSIKDYPGFLLYTIYTFLFISYFVKRYIPYYNTTHDKLA